MAVKTYFRKRRDISAGFLSTDLQEQKWICHSGHEVRNERFMYLQDSKASMMFSHHHRAGGLADSEARIA
jgi:hypothetical protein